jgi:hypothetical protein
MPSYILQASGRKRDRQGLTPLDHAMQKGLLVTEVLIRRLGARGVWEVVQGMGLRRVCDRWVFFMLLIGSNEMEQACWLWRVIFFSNLYASYSVVCFALDARLSDLSSLHLLNSIVHSVWWLCFVMCLSREPGYLYPCADSSGGGSNSADALLGQSYGQLLAQGYGVEDNKAGNSQGVSLCHSCKIRRPLRSKHCKFQNKCVAKFDHFCPYVYNTIGRDNYKFFFTLLVTHPIAFGLFIVTTCFYLARSSWTVVFCVFLAYSCLMLMLMLGLLTYHLRLVMRNITTNEDIGIQKYLYLWTEHGDYQNPFRKATAWESLLEVYHPDKRLYYTRQEVVQTLQQDEQHQLQQARK